ncbi:TetR/AcrR family transcriptional regulator [uncultured Litoreibacter sp.]|uniref:TetR/AcrR family transcriptional regulator n=1 Tax=uncultured Litoreibacter sp. TaxID=1392394 RepID=UPI00261D81F9|nr:TetR/AcrR family transcriptional regulator [uncultured Litoreibacter sp.]
MPRTSKTEKAKTHALLLSVAADQLRRRGFSGLNVSEVMKAAGLTHGGFYRHFKSKEDLAIAATRRAFSFFVKELELDLAAHPPHVALNSFVDRYLSTEHLNDISKGCPVAALGADMARCSAAERVELEQGTDRLAEVLDAGLTEDQRQAGISGSTLIAVLSGAINVARLQPDPERQTEILAAARNVLPSFGDAADGQFGHTFPPAAQHGNNS